ncbi:MAG TPA: HAD family hydrolase [Gaiellaceae bacterium]|nr:HAD family hydrolase [Gaiellaceae bacterium]
MAVEAIVFDIGETLVDETHAWQLAAETVGVPPFTVMGVLGGLAARGEHHTRVWEVLGVPPPRARFAVGDFYPDALPCLERLRGSFRVGAVGNTGVETEALLEPYVDFVGSSMRWGVEKPSPEFFARLVDETGVAPEKIAYVGDRVDNDIVPVLAAGMVAVHIRRGPWGFLHDAPAAAVGIRSLDELPAVLL